MPIEVNLAKLSPTMESGQMVKWYVKVGDTVKEGDTLAEIQTDKAVMPMESFDEGVVAILDVKSNEELHRILNDWTDIIPAHFDTYPLVDTAATTKMLAEQAGKTTT